MSVFKKHEKLINFILDLFRDAIWTRKILLVRIVTALALLQVSHVLVILLVQGFLVAFFAAPDTTFVALNDLLPKKLFAYFSFDSDLHITKSTLAWVIPLAIVAAGFVRAVAGYWYNYSQEEVAQRLARRHRERMFASILKIPYLSSAKRNAGEWMSIVMADATFLQSRFSELLTGFVKDGVEIVTLVVVLAFIHLPAAGVLIVVIPVLGWLLGRAAKRISFYAEAFQRELGTLASLLLGIRERFRFMKSQKGEPFEQHLFARANDRYLKMMNESIFLRAFVTPTMEWVGFVLFAGLFWAWANNKMGSGFTPEIAVTFFVVLGSLLRPVKQMGEQIAKFGETMGGLKRSQSLYNELNAVNQSRDSTSLTNGTQQPMRMRPLFDIEHIVLKYEDQEVFVARDITLPSGKAIAIVGGSGAGKSTFLKSLAGLISPDLWKASHPWEVTVNHSSFVSQSPFLFLSTLKENLLYGMDSAIKSQTTDEMLHGALKIVALDHLVRELPLGLETMFNPLATNFSGGQIQRFVIARALLRRKPMLLLDEATSAVDGSTERDLYKILINTVHETGTILVSVTHRLTWLSFFDEVWFVRSGKIALKGTHDSLLKNQDYADFCLTEKTREITAGGIS